MIVFEDERRVLFFFKCAVIVFKFVKKSTVHFIYV